MAKIGVFRNDAAQLISRVFACRKHAVLILLVVAGAALEARPQISRSAVQATAPEEHAKSGTANLGVGEPEFEGIFFRLMGGELLPLERQAVAIKIKASGFIVMNAKGTLEIEYERSPVRFRAGEAMEFIVRSPAAASAADPTAMYHLRKLQAKKGKREAIAIREHVSPIGASVNAASTYPYGERLWRMSHGRPDSGMDESHRTRCTTEEMAGIDPSARAEQAVGECVLSSTRLQRSVLL